MATYGYPQSDWDAAKSEALAVLTERARKGRTIAYSDLAARIKSIMFNAQDHAFHGLLGEISSEEDEAGRGMLSVLVIHKSGEAMPGPGFFTLAESLDRDVSDKLRFWAQEFGDVLAAHKST